MFEAARSMLLNSIYGDIPSLPAGGTDNPFLRKNNGRLSLHFDHLAIQSEMHIDEPDALALGYTRTMMGFLLFQPQPEHIAMIGLGGGSLAKYCLRHLPKMRFTAVEINPAILEFRQAFHIPDDGSQFRVLCADGADYMRCDEDDPLDVLLLDCFDGDCPPPQLCTLDFYADCYTRLSTDGILVANYWSGDHNGMDYIARIRECFANQVLVINACEPGNKIVFAIKDNQFPLDAATLLQRAIEPDPHHPIHLQATAQKLLKQLHQAEWLTRRHRASTA